MSLRVCVYGNGAREASIREAVRLSPLCKSLVDINDSPDLIIFGPEQPICDGLVDIYSARGIKCIGVDRKFSKLESSKLYAKNFMKKYGINNAAVLDCNCDIYPQVIKKDGLCKGKGVKVLYNEIQKKETIDKFKDDFFIEEFLDGKEISFMSYFNGERLINFCPARDFKRLSSDLDSPNTGGMGAYCPVELSARQSAKLDIYLRKLVNALVSEGAKFSGFIYSGLIWAKDDWYVLEYNVRLGDPECQAILTHLENDFLSVLLNNEEPKYKSGYGACLTVASQGYPDEPVKGDLISLPNNYDDVKVYYAGVKVSDGKLYSDGGRVLSLCTNSDNPFPILKSYADDITMEHKYYRSDVEIS